MPDKIHITDFSPHLFWDMDLSQFDFEVHKSQLVFKVVTYGMMHDWELLQKAYSFESLKEVALNLRTIDKVSLSFLAHFFKVDKTAFRCYTQNLSPQGFWIS